MKPSEKFNKYCDRKEDIGVECNYLDCPECWRNWMDKNTWLKSDVRKVIKDWCKKKCPCPPKESEYCCDCSHLELLKELNKLNEK